MDEREVCFMLEVSHSLTRLCDHTAKLLAHPLQRPRQQDIEHQLIECSPNDEPIQEPHIVKYSLQEIYNTWHKMFAQKSQWGNVSKINRLPRKKCEPCTIYEIFVILILFLFVRTA